MVPFYGRERGQEKKRKRATVSVGWKGREIANDRDKDVDATEKHPLIEEFVVIVQQDGRVVDGGESKGRDADLSQKTTVCCGREDLCVDLESLFVLGVRL